MSTEAKMSSSKYIDLERRVQFWIPYQRRDLLAAKGLQQQLIRVISGLVEPLYAERLDSLSLFSLELRRIWSNPIETHKLDNTLAKFDLARKSRMRCSQSQGDEKYLYSGGEPVEFPTTEGCGSPVVECIRTQRISRQTKTSKGTRTVRI